MPAGREEKTLGVERPPAGDEPPKSAEKIKMEQALERLQMLKAKEQEYNLKRQQNEPIALDKKTQLQLEKEKMKRDLLAHRSPKRQSPKRSSQFALLKEVAKE